jgi:hypothetical protein
MERYLQEGLVIWGVFYYQGDLVTLTLFKYFVSFFTKSGTYFCDINILILI